MTQCASGSRPVRAEMDRERGDVERAVAREPLAAEADRQQIARAELRPVRAVRIEQEAVAPARDGEAEVIVDALVEPVERGRPQRGRELHAGYPQGGGIGGDVERCGHRAIVTASGNP